MFTVYITFVFLISYLTGGKTFIKYDIIVEKIGVISFNSVTIIGFVLSAVVPMITLRYQRIRYIFLYILSGIMLFVFLYCLVWGVLFLIYHIFDDIFYCPLNTFDAIYYAMLTFRGAGIGTLLALIINLIKNRSLKNNSN